MFGRTYLNVILLLLLLSYCDNCSYFNIIIIVINQENYVILYPFVPLEDLVPQETVFSIIKKKNSFTI